jgi:hypothetical protein
MFPLVEEINLLAQHQSLAAAAAVAHNAVT